MNWERDEKKQPRNTKVAEMMMMESVKVFEKTGIGSTVGKKWVRLSNVLFFFQVEINSNHSFIKQSINKKFKRNFLL